MKRLTLLLIVLALAVSAIAKDLKRDITLVSYEQRWLDMEGTLALKNNTNENIHNVVFQITYLDMSGKALDYEEFKRRISIAPGMTKKIDIPAYEHERFYHYFKSENKPGGSPSFKIDYKLIGYNYPEDAEDDYDPFGAYDDNEYQYSNSSNNWFWLFAIIAVLFGMGFYIGMYVLVAVLAQQRHRSVVAWILLSMFCSPIIMIIILLCIGDAQRDVYE